MNQAEIRNFVEAYFFAHQSEFVERHPSYITVKLPKEVDKDLGNRPFYWSYTEKMGIEPQPLVLTFVFDRNTFPNHVKAEEIRFGCNRLNQLFASTKKHGRFVRMFEHERGQSLSPLVPWLNMNYQIEFICDKKKDSLLSMGINLNTGEIRTDFYKSIQGLSLVPKLPNYQYTLQPFLSIESAVARTEKYVQTELEKEEDTWAVQARERLDEEKTLLEEYYRGVKEDNLSEKEQRLKELNWQYEPRIDVTTVNAGIFYLKS